MVYHVASLSDILEAYHGEVVMRILVDVPKSELELMDAAVKQLTISRSEFVRRAIAASLTPYRHKMHHGAFASWCATGEDGLEYQQRMRGEW
jgi:hypothetical protein